MASSWGNSWGRSWGNSWGILFAAPEKIGGDDAFYPNKHTGWNKKNWEKQRLKEKVIEKTIEDVYKKILGIEPKTEIINEIKKEAIKFNYTQEYKFIKWLSIEINEIDDEEEILLLMI